MTDQKERNKIREIFNFKEVLSYYFRKRGGGEKPDINLRIMHWINKISIIIFILAILILLIRNLFLR